MYATLPGKEMRIEQPWNSSLLHFLFPSPSPSPTSVMRQFIIVPHLLLASPLLPNSPHEGATALSITTYLVVDLLFPSSQYTKRAAGNPPIFRTCTTHTHSSFPTKPCHGSHRMLHHEE